MEDMTSDQIKTCIDACEKKIKAANQNGDK